MTQISWCIFGVDAPEQVQASASNLRGQRITVGFAFGQTIVLQPPGIAVKPDCGCPAAEPIWRDAGERSERLAQPFTDTLQPIEDMDGR